MTTISQITRQPEDHELPSPNDVLGILAEEASKPEPSLLIEACEFYFVWTKTGRVPRFVHETAAEAETEAERLAILHPGRKFIVRRAYHQVSALCPAEFLKGAQAAMTKAEAA